ncbi:MAG: uracil-DNA glycosylase [Firmicutes bacterium]|nr:uracil-DNA glycosylase [Bacillota bacterium]MCL2255559.1 uracil-DNA glycosylase [Bacillota bacterium]
MLKLNNDWDDIIRDEILKPYYLELREFLKLEYTTQTIFPPMHEIFSALRETSYSETKVVILGQDPYINEGEAHGMAFSVKHGAKIPPSLKNIFNEIHTDVGATVPNNGYLISWAKQGVLMLNTVLTVRKGASKSHAKKGWEKFTTFLIEKLNEKNSPIVFLLWGRDAQTKTELLTNSRHLVLAAAHPSPLAGGAFFGCKHFSKTNDFLKNNKLTEIDWQIENN